MKINLNLNLEPNDSLSSAIKYKKKGVVAKALLEPFRPVQNYTDKLNQINKYINIPHVNYQNFENQKDEILKMNNYQKFITSDKTSVINLERQNYIDNISPVKFDNKNNYLNNKTINISDFKSYENNINKDFSNFHTNNTDNIKTIKQTYKNFNDKNINSFENINKNIFKNIKNNPLNSFNFAENKSTFFRNSDLVNNMSYLNRDIINSKKENQTEKIFKNQINENKMNKFSIIDFPQNLPRHFFKNFIESKTENNFPINYSPTINIQTNDIKSFDFAGELKEHQKDLKKMLISQLQQGGIRIYDR